MNKKSQGWLATLFSWGQRRQSREAEKLYAAAIEVARRPVFYQQFGVQDSVDGRFDTLSLVGHIDHAAIKELRGGRKRGQPTAF